MFHFGHQCPKRSVLWSSNAAIVGFWTGKLKMNAVKQRRARSKGCKPVQQSIDKHGKKRFNGTPDLTATGIHS
jgi:hypothetical protein